MYKVISMLTDDELPIDVPFLANAATPFRYKELFGKDLLILFQKSMNNDGVYDIDFVSELAFVMAMQAKAKDEEIDLNHINREDMLEWLEQFGGFEMLTHSQEIMSIYLGNMKTTSKEKKKVRKPSAS